MYCMLALSGLLFDQTTCNRYKITEYEKRCPHISEWKVIAAVRCKEPSNYYCLWDDYQKEYRESCRNKPTLWPLVSQSLIKVYSKKIMRQVPVKEMDDYCEVIEFLKDRNASDESIQKIKEEKVLTLMYCHDCNNMYTVLKRLKLPTAQDGDAFRQ
ncbi:unnamed protein product [Mytilus coruscus]|uniref:Uncharacterized protein n=1 Tax=Mytilus coruscus TaxID=42192 RepID=A0A6J8EN91_MYTCO|nr:unnamed protein product [Mytilus coruscus]